MVVPDARTIVKLVPSSEQPWAVRCPMNPAPPVIRTFTLRWETLACCSDYTLRTKKKAEIGVSAFKEGEASQPYARRR